MAAFAKPDSLLYFGISYGIIAIAIFWSMAHAWKGGIYYIRISSWVVGGTTLLFQTPFSKGLGELGTSIEPYFMLMFIMGFVGFAIGGVTAIIFENKGYMHGEGILIALFMQLVRCFFQLSGGIVVFAEWVQLATISIVIQSDRNRNNYNRSFYFILL